MEGDTYVSVGIDVMIFLDMRLTNLDYTNKHTSHITYIIYRY